MDFEDIVHKKIAGVPVVLVAMVFAAALLYGAFKLKPTPDPAADAPTDALATDPPDTSQPVFEATPVIYQPSGGSVASTPGPDSNEKWGRRSIEWLIANDTPLDLASGAITKYLNGESLTSDERLARDKAVAQFGLPPEPVDYAPPAMVRDSVYKGPATKQGEPPLKHVVKGKSDDTNLELSRLYYGFANADTLAKINAANIGSVSPYAVGTAVKIPELRRPKYYRATSAARDAFAIAARNGTTASKVYALNPGMDFPVKVGTRVRIH